MVSSNWLIYTMSNKDTPFLIAAFPFPMVFFIHSFLLFLRIPFLTNFLFWLSSAIFFIHPTGLSSQHEKVSDMVSIYVYTVSMTICPCPFECLSPLQVLFVEFKSFHSVYRSLYRDFSFLSFLSGFPGVNAPLALTVKQNLINTFVSRICI